MTIKRLLPALLMAFFASTCLFAQNDKIDKIEKKYPTESEGYDEHKSQMQEMREQMAKRFKHNESDSSGDYSFRFDTTFNNGGGSFSFSFGGNGLNMMPFDSAFGNGFEQLRDQMKRFNSFDFPRGFGGDLFQNFRGFDQKQPFQGFDNFFKNDGKGFSFGFDSSFVDGFEGFDNFNGFDGIQGIDTAFSKSFGFMFDGENFKSFGDTTQHDLFRKMEENMRRMMPRHYQNDEENTPENDTDKSKNKGKKPETKQNTSPKKRFGEQKKSKYQTEDL